MISIKYLLIIVFVLVSIGHRVDAQVIWEDDFDSYVTDSILEPQSPDWGGWGGAVTSALVSGDSAFSGSNCLKIWDGNPPGSNSALSDPVHLFGDSTSGRYLLTFKTRISSDDGSGGSTGTYYNLQHLVAPTTYTGQEWAFDVYLAQGNSYINVGGQQYSIPEVMDEWVDIHHVFDLDRDMHDFFYNGVWIVSVPFSYTNRGPGGTNQLAAIAPYATCATGCTELGYFDDFVFKHFDDPFNDAGITEAFVPTYCSGDSVDIEVALKNWGFNNLGSVDINWSNDGVAQTPFTYSNTLSHGAVDTVFLGKQVFAGTPPYDLKFWTTDPNGVTDTVAFNDTLNAQAGGPAFSGVYTVDPSLPASVTNFTSIQDLVTGLNLSGLCGATTINIASGTYNEALGLSNITGLSATNTLTIDGGDSSQTILSQSSAFATLTFDNVEYVTVRNLTLEKSSGSGDAVIFYQASNNVVENCVTRVPVSSSSANYNIAFTNNRSGHTIGAITHNNLIRNNLVSGGYHGIWLYGSANSYPKGNQIENNFFELVYNTGLYVFYTDSTDIVGNDIQIGDGASQNSNGIYMYFSFNNYIEKNNIISNNYGIHWQTPTITRPRTRGNRMVNNMVSTYGDYGVFLYDVDSLIFWHNSVYSDGAAGSALVIQGGSGYSGYDFRNNIFWNEQGLYIVQISQVDSISFNHFNYNIFGGGSSSQLIINGIQPNLLTYQSNSSMNDSSLQGNPGFVGINNLHIIGTFPNNKGDKLVPVFEDIDGDPRPMSMSAEPDIGADEYTPIGCFYPTATSVKPIVDSAKIYYTPNTMGNLVQVELLFCGGVKGSGTILTSTSDSLIISALSPSTCYELYLREVCARGDTSIWIGPISFQTLPMPPLGVNCNTNSSSIIFSEEFDNPINSDWSGDIVGGNTEGSWNVKTGVNTLVNTGPSEAHSGNSYLYVNSTNSNSQYATVVSPLIDLSQANDSAELSFWLHAFGANMGRLNVGVSSSLNGPFDVLYTYEGANGQLLSTANSPYVPVGVRLDDYIGQQIYIKFEYLIGNSNLSNVAIDLVEVRACASCATPSNQTLTNRSTNSVEVNWLENGVATEWEVVHGAKNFNFFNGGGVSQFVSSKPHEINGLNPYEDYQFYLRSVCGQNDTSGWIGPYGLSSAASVPFYENFDLFEPFQNGNPWPKAWSVSRQTDPIWKTMYGRTPYNTGPLFDHTLGNNNGVYVYSTQFGSQGAASDLLSPEIDIDSNQKVLKISYWYFFYGSTIDQFELYVLSNGNQKLIRTFNNQQQLFQTDSWRKDSLIITGYEGRTIQLMFRTYQSCCEGEYAIDDIEIVVPSGTDPAIAGLSSPAECVGSNVNYDITVEIINYASDTIRSFDITYVLNNGTSHTESYSGSPIAIGEVVSHTFNNTILFPTAGNYNLEVYLSNIQAASANRNDTFRLEYIINAIPSTVNFDSISPGAKVGKYTNGWTSSSSSNFSWTANSGATPSANTGPSSDNTSGTSNGVYMFTEADSGDVGDTAYLNSFCLDLAPVSNLTLNYWYHMYGSAIDRMYVELDSAGTWLKIDSIIGQQQMSSADSFRLRSLNLDNFANSLSTSSVRFVVIRGAGNTADVAIDDVEFTGLSVHLAENTYANKIEWSVYPNPSHQSFTLVLNVPSVKQKNFQLTLRNVNGKKVFSESIDVNGQFIKNYNVESITEGVYFLTVQGDKVYSTQKLIVY